MGQHWIEKLSWFKVVIHPWKLFQDNIHGVGFPMSHRFLDLDNLIRSYFV
jgi:hypothetical protein